MQVDGEVHASSREVPASGKFALLFVVVPHRENEQRTPLGSCTSCRAIPSRAVGVHARRAARPRKPRDGNHGLAPLRKELQEATGQRPLGLVRGTQTHDYGLEPLPITSRLHYT